MPVKVWVPPMSARARLLRELMLITDQNLGQAPGMILCGGAQYRAFLEEMVGVVAGTPIMVGGVPLVFDKWCPPNDIWAVSHNPNDQWIAPTAFWPRP